MMKGAASKQSGGNKKRRKKDGSGSASSIKARKRSKDAAKIKVKGKGADGGGPSTPTSRSRSLLDSTSASQPPAMIGQCPNVSHRYQKVGRVGQGTYGVVYKARDKISNQHVALKRCIPHHESSDGFPLTTLREIHALRVCAQHPNIIRLLHVAVSQGGDDNAASSNKRGAQPKSGAIGGTFLAFEYCPHDIANIIDRHHQRTKSSPFAVPQVKRLLHQLLSAVQHCHDRCIIHRDIKMANLLYSTTGDLKLADFGLARQWPTGRVVAVDDTAMSKQRHPTVEHRLLTPNVVSLWYRPPELLLQDPYYAQRYTCAVDLWAVGCVFAELLDGFPLLSGKDEEEQVRKIIRYLGNPPTTTATPFFPLRKDAATQGNGGRNDKMVDNSGSRHALLDRYCDLTAEGLLLLTNLIHYDPKTRWTAKQSLACSFFREDPKMATKMPEFA